MRKNNGYEMEFRLETYHAAGAGGHWSVLVDNIETKIHLHNGHFIVQVRDDFNAMPKEDDVKRREKRKLEEKSERNSTRVKNKGPGICLNLKTGIHGLGSTSLRLY